MINSKKSKSKKQRWEMIATDIIYYSGTIGGNMIINQKLFESKQSKKK